MKKTIKSIVMLFAASVFILASCSTDKEIADVELTVINPTTTSYFVGEILKVKVTGKGNEDNKLKTLKVTKAVTGSATVTLDDIKASGTDLVYDLVDTLKTADKGTVTYTFVLTGEEGTAQTKTLTITVAEEGFIEETGTAIQMFGHLNDGPRFCNLATFATYSLDVATQDSNKILKENVDLVSYYGTSNKFTLSSPDDAVMQGLYTGLSSFWTSGAARKTGLVKITGSAVFSQVAAPGTDRLLVPLASGKTYGQTTTNVVANDLILFKTQEGKLGLISIKSVTGSSASDAQVQFDGLVQK